MAPGLDIYDNSLESIYTAYLATQKTDTLSTTTAADSLKRLEEEESDWIQSSPYTTRHHALDLTTLTTPLQLFARALAHMKPVRPDYATALYHQSYNWDSIVDQFTRAATAEGSDTTLQPIDLFVIVFRSRINHHADRQSLGELDSAAHVEAVEGGGLLKYWFGMPDDQDRNLATCIWRDREDARRGGAGPGHALAMQAARKMYQEWFVERLRLTVDPKAGTWSFSQWVDDDGHKP